jgi:hypothetical protein
MSALDQAEELRQKAITILLSELQQIEERLAQLGHGDKKVPAVRRGRPPKQQPLISDQPDTTGSVLP